LSALVQTILIMKQITINNNIITGYYVNEFGEVYTTRRMYMNQYTIAKHKKNGTLKEYCCNAELRRVKGSVHMKKYRLHEFPLIFTDLENMPRYKNLYKPKDRRCNKSNWGPRLGIQLHTLMMETFKPFEDNLPPDLVDEWDNLSDVVKRYIKNGMTVDHIDPDYTKDTFHHLSNLQWLTKSDNSRKGNS